MKFLKENIWVFIFLILGLFLAVGIAYSRLDLTEDKRYTLTDISRNILGKVDEPMQIDVYLEGKFPASFKQVQSETVSLLDEMSRINSNITYQLIDPIKEKKSPDSLRAMGVEESVLSVREDGVAAQIKIYPYATIFYKNRGYTVPLIGDRSDTTLEQQLDKLSESVEELEYNFINGVDKLVNLDRKVVGILTNQAELNRLEMYSFASKIVQNYNFLPIFPKDSQSLKLHDLPNMNRVDALIIAKPRKAFTDEEKITIDQYIMNGGKTLWALDVVNAEMDTLLSSDKILAYPYDLNLTDMFFSYGIRLQPAMVKDLQNLAYINLQVGSVQGNAQNERVPWVYFPLGTPMNNNPITKNINPVRFEFPSPIDTIESPEIRKTILYQSSPYTAVQGVPSYVSLEEAKVSYRDSINLTFYNKGPKIMSILLEGKFPSAYADKIESAGIKGFIKESKPNKMIVISDGDIARNQIIKGEPMPLGLDYSTQIMYGNEEFLVNALNYLMDDTGLMQLRNRNISQKFLNKSLVSVESSYWQWLNLLVPLIFIWGIGGIFIYWRKKKF